MFFYEELSKTIFYMNRVLDSFSHQEKESMGEVRIRGNKQMNFFFCQLV